MTTSTQTTLDKIREKFNFTVDKFPLTGPDGCHTPLYGLFRSDTSDLVGSSSVTSRYVPHETDDVLAIVEATQEVFSDCDAQCHFSEGHYVNLAPSADMRRSIYGTTDNIFPRLTIFAGYDGRSFSTTMGYFRDLCINLSMMKSITSTNVRIRHTSNLRANMSELIDQFHGLKNGWEDLTTLILRMEAAPVRLATFLDSVYGLPEGDEGRAVTIHKNRTEKIFRRVTDERRRSGRPQLDDTYTVSAWEAYNAVQGFTQHDATRRKSSTPFDRIISASRDQSVSKAEGLAVAAAA